MTGRPTPRRKRREKCGGPRGKDIYATKDEARADLPSFRAEHGGHGKLYRCAFGEHYHITKGFLGKKGKGRR